ncbi:MAG: hypothetical protein MUC48_06055 [Leptolyngbya sp. Prado105]|jgi:hypothetical protein|nr:hypothetical protein [Leptolyngbya sp. Prado105]
MSEKPFSEEEPLYQSQQQRYWAQLHRELERYKTTLGTTNTELAQCLGISRQPLVTFMQKPELGLPIQRWNLIRLWDLLTDPAHFHKKLSNSAQEQRMQLRQQGSDALLKAAGFLPDSQKPSLEIHPNRYQQIQRIVSRLSNLPIQDFAEFIMLTDFLEMFVTNSLPRKHQISAESPALEATGIAPTSTEARIDRWIKFNHSLPNAPEGIVKHKLEGALSRLAISGKSELNNTEFFELYMSIADNERLNSHIDHWLKMRITQCEFTTVTFAIKSFLSPQETDYIWRDIEQASLDAERQLRPEIAEFGDPQDAVAEPVIEALITCHFGAEDKGKIVQWRYSASTTHFETMLAALGHGMGYDADLELVDFSTRTLGHKDYSLIRASTAFRPIDHRDRENYPTYQSVWVDRSTILGILQSAVVAVRGWLAENFPDKLSCQSYYEVCLAVAEIDNNLVQGKKVLNGYRIQQGDYADGLSAKEYLETAVIEKINQLKQGTLKQYPKLRDCYEADLDRKYWIAKLAYAHSAMIEGNIIIALRLLQEMQDFLKASSRKNLILQVAYEMELNLQQFYQGDPAIFSDSPKWRVTLPNALQELSNYIQNSKQDCGRFDSDVYVYACEVWGRLARLNFCCTHTEEDLNASVHQFLMAAYCAAKTGHRHRTSHWINNASRACVRLGEGDRAKAFAELAERVIRRALEPTYSPEYQDAIQAEVNIARGERMLLIERNTAGALDYFLRSLKGSIYIGFTRLIADNFYNIARAAENLGNYRIRKSFESAFGKEDAKASQSDWFIHESDQSWKENKIAAEAIQFINQLNKDDDWNSVAAQFKQQSQKIWRGWASSSAVQQNTQHPIEREIQDNQYLKRIR